MIILVKKVPKFPLTLKPDSRRMRLILATLAFVVHLNFNSFTKICLIFSKVWPNCRPLSFKRSGLFLQMPLVATSFWRSAASPIIHASKEDAYRGSNTVKIRFKSVANLSAKLPAFPAVTATQNPRHENLHEVNLFPRPALAAQDSKASEI